MHPSNEAATIPYRDVTIAVWRTDDPMEPPGDDPEAEGPFEIGDFYCSVLEWGYQTGVSVPTFRQMLEKARAAVDAVLGADIHPVAALRLGDVAPLPLEPSAMLSGPSR